jgi:GR25 family glycosyltransferase involved in LPS biosynthesis
MKAYVITIMDNERSVQSANRCIKSGQMFGIVIEKHKAVTPEDSPMKIASDKQIPIEGFEEVYSKFDRCLSAFLSHYSLWEKCIKIKEPILILEHDAVFVNMLPPFFQASIVNCGKPSYGRFRTPAFLGESPLISKRYLPGAHAYYIDPKAAKQLIDKARTHAAPTDVFINLDNFSDIKEYYPWPVEAKDSFTTIQNRNGCAAKHNYGETYEIL